MLTALATEHERDRRRVCRNLCHRRGLHRRECRRGSCRVHRHHAFAPGKGASPDLQGEGDIGQILFRVLRKPSRHGCGAAAQADAGGRRIGQDLHRPHRRLDAPRGRLFQDHMCIGTADAERAHRGAAGNTRPGSREIAQRAGDAKRTRLVIELGIGSRKMQAWRDEAMVQAEHRLD